MQQIIHKNKLVINSKGIRYVTHDGYTFKLDWKYNKSNLIMFIELKNFIQEIADNGSEGTFLTGAFHNFIINGFNAYCKSIY